jgi:hypothetical protein
MRRARTCCGSDVQGETPDWAPLEAAVGRELTGWFMWMHEVRLADGPSIHAYKHVVTRRYLHLTGDGRAFAYTGGECYRELPLATAVTLVLPG